MKRTLTLGVTVAVGVALMCVSTLGTFGASPALAQQAIPEAPIITTPGVAERIETDGGAIHVLAGEAHTNGTFNVFDSVQQPGAWAGDHAHGFAESFYVVEGTLTVQINGGVIRELPPGSYVFIPGGVRHAQGNKGTTPVRTVMTTLPAGMERTFRQRAEEVRKTRQANPK